MESLKDTLRDWCDIDAAQFELARCLGAIDKNEKFSDTKHLWWTNNPVGNMMYHLLEFLVAEGMLERRDTQYRWKTPTLVEIISPALQGSIGVIRGEKFDSCFVVELLDVPNGYLQLPCVQTIDKRYVKIIHGESK